MENRKSPDRRHINRYSLIPVVILLGAVAAACQQETPSPERLAFLATYQAYEGTAHAMQTEDAQAFRTKYPLETPTATPPPRQKRMTPMNCAQVKENGTVYQALLDAHNGTLPGETDPDGYITEVQIDHKDPATLNNIRMLMTLAQVLSQNPTVAQGDRVCYSADADRLQQIPTPTPGPYQTPTPQALRQNNERNRSFAVAVNRPVPFRRKA